MMEETQDKTFGQALFNRLNSDGRLGIFVSRYYDESERQAINDEYNWMLKIHDEMKATTNRDLPASVIAAHILYQQKHGCTPYDVKSDNAPTTEREREVYRLGAGVLATRMGQGR